MRRLLSALAPLLVAVVPRIAVATGTTSLTPPE